MRVLFHTIVKHLPMSFSKYLFLILVVGLLLAACTTTKDVPVVQPDEMLQSKADMLAHKYIITDGHVDLPYRLKVKNFRLDKELLGIPIETDEGDFDFVRAKKGGLDAPFMSIYLPSNLQSESGASKLLADSLINMVNSIAAAHPDKFAIAFTPRDCEVAFSKGMVALPMGMENGSGIEDDLKNVQYFRDRGISYITLTHAKDNLICDSSYDTLNTWGGLSPYGKEVIVEMNKAGIMVDISHVSDNAFYQAIELSKAPVIASHSSCRKYTPGFQRNMNDEMIELLGQKGGVIAINFGSTFLDGDIQADRDKKRAELMKLFQEAGVEYGSPEADEIIEKFSKTNPTLYSDVQMVANHIDNVVKIAGIDHVGLGSDFDGVGDSLPTGLKDVAQYPNLIHELLLRGYSEEDIAKICYKNVFRVWQQTLDVAQKS